MNTIRRQDINAVSSAIKADKYLSELYSQKAAITNHKKNILSSDEIIAQQINDCFFSFFADFIQKKTHTYHKFINAAFPEQAPPGDKTVQRHFKRFKENVNQLEKQYTDNCYIPPFISYITESMISNHKTNTQTHRNYEYKFFNARSYYYILQNMECLPYFHKNRNLSIKEWIKFFDLLLETNAYPLSEQAISQYCIDYYFSIPLFIQTLGFFKEKHEPPFYNITEHIRGLYSEYFLFLCTLLQASSGICTKQGLFHIFKEIFFGTGISRDEPSDYLKLFKGDYRECFKQCAIELVFYNEIIYPYIKSLYYKEFCAMLEKKCLSYQKSDFEKLFENILDVEINADLYNMDMPAKIGGLAEFSLRLSESDLSAINYVAQKFYNYTPTLSNKNYQKFKPSYSELEEQISLFLEVKFLNIEMEYNKNAGFPI